jgi:hypothetical protein
VALTIQCHSQHLATLVDRTKLRFAIRNAAIAVLVKSNLKATPQTLRTNLWSADCDDAKYPVTAVHRRRSETLTVDAQPNGVAPNDGNELRAHFLGA